MPEAVELIADGFDEWIKAAEEKVHQATVKGVATVVEKAVARAKELCPVDTGNLRDSISGKVSAGGHFGEIRSDSKKAYYNRFVEYGTVNMAGRPFLHQAAEAAPAELNEEIKRNLAD